MVRTAGQRLANSEVLGVNYGEFCNPMRDGIRATEHHLCNGATIDSTIESIHEILDLEAQVVAVSVFLQPKRAIHIETAFFIRLAHEGSPFCQLQKSGNPIV